MKDEFYEIILAKVKNSEITSETAYALIQGYKKNIKGNSVKSTQDVAIIGISCRYPEADDKSKYWQNIIEGKDSVRDFPLNRREEIEPLLDIEEKKYFKGGYLDSISGFDYKLFNLSKEEAIYMDPQHRILLETSYEAFEDAGYKLQDLQKSNTGIFLGNSGSDYAKFINRATPHAVIGNASTFMAGRISHYFDLKGPSLMVNTACSSSLVAVHMACQSLITKESDLTIAGGVSLFLTPLNIPNDIWNIVGITSKEEKCKAFDDDAEGIAKGEGCAIIVLKRLDDALRDKDHIYAVIKSTVANQDGHSNGLTSPNPLAQSELIKQAWNKAQINPETIGYFEAHGTGTKLGDPIEINGINLAFKGFTGKKQFCAIGSSKSNIGHLADGGAGVAGLIKATLALYHKKIPPTIHLNNPNRLINFVESAVYVNDIVKEWKGEKRRAGVSSFGLSGTNCHIVLEEAPTDSNSPENESVDRDKEIITISARSKSSLINTLQKYINYLEGQLNYSLKDLCYSTNTGRTSYQHRIAIIFSNREDLVEKLQYLLQKDLQIKGTKKLFYSFDDESLYNDKIEDNQLINYALSYVRNEAVDWSNYYSEKDCRRVPVPTYGFDQEKCWIQEARKMSIETKGQMQVALSDKQPRVNRNNRTIYPHQVEEELIRICKEVLAIDSIETDSDLFEVGMQSLKVISLSSRISEVFNVEIPVSEIFENPTIQLIANQIKRATKKEFSTIKPTENQEWYPLSSAQKRLYIIDAFQDVGTSYNVYGAIKIKGNFSIERFEKAIKTLINRHEAFRTYFKLVDDEPVQSIIDELDFKIIYENDTSKADEFISKFISKFDLSKAPLIKIGLATTDSSDYILVFDMHHIISDGTSIGILIQEFIDIYEGKQLKELKIQYKDFAIWQNSLFHEERIKKQEKYWLEKFSGKIPMLSLPTDHPRPLMKSFLGDKVQFIIGKEIIKDLKILANTNQSTLYMVFLGAITILLSKYSGDEVITIGSPVAGRQHVDLDRVLGMFVNTIAIMNSPKSDKRFIEFLNEVRKNTLEAFENQEYQFEELIRKLNLDRDLSKNPLFSVLFAFQNMHIPKTELKDLEITTLEMENHTSLFDLRIEAREVEEEITFIWEYATDLFKRASIEKMADDFLKILKVISENKEIKIGDIKLRGSKEPKKNILEDIEFDL